MAFEDEWKKVLAQASEKSPLELNGTGGYDDRGGSKDQLNVSSSVLEERARKAEIVRGNFRDSDNKVMGATEKVELKGFKSDAAIATFQKRWRRQMRHMDGLLENGVINNLRTSAVSFRAEEQKRLRETKKLHQEGNGS
ncbi:hypothetical protein ABZV77_18570 [Streptomyces sp. NPDC004732]|uniref:hypothetical protein n=1 Tax=Streptomyces sp. NPDC004732 TaxID=3154290 RepID=UPI0033B0AB08